MTEEGRSSLVVYSVGYSFLGASYIHGLSPLVPIAWSPPPRSPLVLAPHPSNDNPNLFKGVPVVAKQ